MAFDKESFLAGIAVGRRLTPLLQNNITISAEPEQDSLKVVKIADKKEAEEKNG